ncbi:MAG TPA: VCBS repeat-containing protein [Verrucomicrobiae bacterium]|nr:VCBS repeat-containing protein [Verrucomicrobiae bacterium]
MLYLGRGDGTYAEIAQLSGLEASEWSWSPVFLDVDLDGYEDVLVCNGFERDGMNVDILRQMEALKREKKRPTVEQLRLRQLFPRLATANLAFKNLRSLRFQDTSADWGFNFQGVSHGIALADLDNDGGLDVVLNNMNDPACLYRNEGGAPRVAVRLQGRSPNTRGIGARITLVGNGLQQSQEMMAGGRYLSSDDAMRTFAAVDGEMRLEVAWRAGGHTIISPVKGNQLYIISEEGASPSNSKITNQLTRFEDVSSWINHRHREDAFDDFALQPLLPKRLSQLGPGVAWFDWDGDGWEDLFIGSGGGGELAGYHNNEGKGFTRLSGPPWNQPVTRDQTALVGWRRGNGEVALLVGSANYEDGLTNGSVVRQYDAKAKKVLDPFPGQLSSTGPVALGDIDGDQDLDLFVGGRVNAGRYAEGASSLIFRDEGGEWKADRANNARLEKVGLVSGAVWSDVDGDGDVDLVLACEWGPVRVFRNEKGMLSDVTKELGLDEYRGWWNGVPTGDFDGDGRMDIVASNWGSNSKYQHFGVKNLRLFCGDIDGDTRVECIEGYEQRGRLLPLQPFHVVAAGMPLLRERISSYDLYGKSTLNEIYPAPFKMELQVSCLDSTIFLNRGQRFTAAPLPLEAQFAPAFATCVGDFDGDGQEDLFLSQNFFASEPETSRSDAGRGLLLYGDGRGSFRSVPGQESGIRIYGEQRGAAICDFDQDGRPDLVVAQNGAESVLLRNRDALPGLRVRLVGPPRNPMAIGAILRLQSAGQLGPAREIHSNAGYWSQNSTLQILAGARPPTLLSVRWPGGSRTTTGLPQGAKEVTVDYRGILISSR